MANNQSFDELLRQRLGVIQEQGVNSTIAVKDQVARQQQEAFARQEIERQRLNKVASQNASDYQFTAQPSSTGGPKGFDAFMQAISQQESGGNYGIVNPDSGALGKYQIMPGNISGWSKAALGHSVSRSAFLGSPDIQEAVAKYQLQQYYQKYGPAGAAVAWYAGEGNAKKYVASGGKGYNRKQGKYPSVSKYVQDILKKMGYA